MPFAAPFAVEPLNLSNQQVARRCDLKRAGSLAVPFTESPVRAAGRPQPSAAKTSPQPRLRSCGAFVQRSNSLTGQRCQPKMWRHVAVRRCGSKSAKSAAQRRPTCDWLPAQAPGRSTSERGASVLCQFHLSGGKLDPSAPGHRQSRVASGRALSARRLHRHQHGASRQKCRRFLQQTRHLRAVDQGGQGRDQMDAAVMPDVRRQRRPAPASCAGLQSRQFLAHAGDARADQRLVSDEPEGEADQDRCEGGLPRTLCRLPDGGGRHPTADVPRDFAADCGTTAAATTSASVRRAIVMRSQAIDGRSASKCQRK